MSEGEDGNIGMKRRTRSLLIAVFTGLFSLLIAGSPFRDAFWSSNGQADNLNSVFAQGSKDLDPPACDGSAGCDACDGCSDGCGP